MQNAYRWIKCIPPGFLIKYLNYITKFSVSLNVSFLILPGRATSVNHKYNCRVTVIYPFVKRKYLSHSAQAQNSFVFSILVVIIKLLQYLLSNYRKCFISYTYFPGDRIFIFFSNDQFFLQKFFLIIHGGRFN
jgi:hypothetical protein